MSTHETINIHFKKLFNWRDLNQHSRSLISFRCKCEFFLDKVGIMNILYTRLICTSYDLRFCLRSWTVAGKQWFWG